MKTVGPNLVKLTSDKWAKDAGLNWEARFNHPVRGLVVLPFETRAQAVAAKIVIVGVA